uniref:Uncharacterized protein n=1 Tax=Leersia perrieri TaxID=77586 RepID=A0A0D9WCK5_9ORYZ
MAPLSFSVRRRDPELIVPAAPTPRETKRLSDLDDQDALRSLIPGVFVYRAGDGGDPVDVIRRAIAAVLVPYYPLAGRLREVEDRKLVVDCTGEGVVFVEADADVTAAELGLRPPFPCSDRLLVDGGDGAVVDSPLNHVICDAAGLVMFLDAVADHAGARRRDQAAVSPPPPWCRELLDARNPPNPSSSWFPLFHGEDHAAPPPPPPDTMMPMRSFSFSAGDIAVLKRRHHRENATSFEVLAAFVWRAHAAAAAASTGDGEEACLAFIVSVRSNGELRLPGGYYGNAAVPATATMPVSSLLRGPLADVVDRVRDAKAAAATAEYVRSTVDSMALARRRRRPMVGNFLIISDVRRTGLHRVDFGWGPPIYGGPVKTMVGATFFVAAGEDEVVVPVVLPAAAMERFASEVERVHS